MKIWKILLVLLIGLESSFAAPAREKTRTIADIPGLALPVLQRTLSATIYGHLVVSPVKAWVAVRGQLTDISVSNARVIHSEDGGTYDEYALQLARNWRIAGHYGLDKLSPTASVVFNLLIFEIADGTMAISFPCFEEPGGSQLEYYGAAKLAVQQTDGQWKDLALPKRPGGVGNHADAGGDLWTVRAGLKNNWELLSLLDECISPGK